MCAMMACAPCQPPQQNVADGSCCGECRDVSTQPVPVGCVVKANHYNVGLYILIIYSASMKTTSKFHTLNIGQYLLHSKKKTADS